MTWTDQRDEFSVIIVSAIKVRVVKVRVVMVLTLLPLGPGIPKPSRPSSPCVQTTAFSVLWNISPLLESNALNCFNFLDILRGREDVTSFLQGPHEAPEVPQCLWVRGLPALPGRKQKHRRNNSEG